MFDSALKRFVSFIYCIVFLGGCDRIVSRMPISYYWTWWSRSLKLGMSCSLRVRTSCSLSSEMFINYTSITSTPWSVFNYSFTFRWAIKLGRLHFSRPYHFFLVILFFKNTHEAKMASLQIWSIDHSTNNKTLWWVSVFRANRKLFYVWIIVYSLKMVDYMISGHHNGIGIESFGNLKWEGLCWTRRSASLMVVSLTTAKWRTDSQSSR